MAGVGSLRGGKREGRRERGKEDGGFASIFSSTGQSIFTLGRISSPSFLSSRHPAPGSVLASSPSSGISSMSHVSEPVSSL